METQNEILPNIVDGAWRFAPHTYASYVSGGEWKCWKYLRYIGNVIADAIYKGGGRIIINCPPRHGKSELVSKWAPLWFLNLQPQKRVILASYEMTTASEWGRKCRNEIETNPAVGIQLRGDSTSAERWNTVAGGGMTCAGVGSPITGRGGELLIIDDAIKNWQEAWSPLTRSRLQEWYSSTFSTRLEPGGTIIVAMTRWHSDDLVGWLVEQQPSEKWKVISLPAIAEPGDILGRQPGDALCPERYDAESLKQIQAARGRAVWSALYQQKPIQVGAGLAYENYSTANINAGLGLRYDLPIQVSFDFNINPGNHVEIGQYDPRADMFTCVHEIHGPRLSVRSAMEQLVKLLETQGTANQEIQIFGDASGKSKSAATADSCYDLIVARLAKSNLRFRMRVPAANPPISNRVQAFNEALKDMDGKSHFQVHPRCVRLLADFKNQKTDADGFPDESDIELGHAVAAEGYRVHYLRPLSAVIAKTMPQRSAGRIIVGTG